MIFQFEQIQLYKQKGGQRWDLKELDLRELKAVFSKWQYDLDGCGWNSLFHVGETMENTESFLQKC